MIKETSIIGLPILDKNNNLIDYEVREIIYSFENTRVVGFSLQKLNITKKIGFLLFTKIKSITEEGILINSAEDIVTIEQMPQLKNLIKKNKTVIGNEVYSSKGEIVGLVKDVLLQIQSGLILGFVISEGLFDDLVKGYSFLPLYQEIRLMEDRIVLNDNKDWEILPQQGGLKKMLGIYEEN